MVEILLTEHALAVIVSPVTMATIFFALPYLSADKSTCVTLSIVKRFNFLHDTTIKPYILLCYLYLNVREKLTRGVTCYTEAWHSSPASVIVIV